MADRLTPEQRHKCMSSVRNKNTKPELTLRKALWQKGFRYRVNVKTLPGKPDIVFAKYKTVIFCDGAFWHGYDWENKKKEIKSNKSFWHDKIEKNMERDVRITKELSDTGWKVLRFWDFQIKKELDNCIGIILSTLYNS